MAQYGRYWLEGNGPKLGELCCRVSDSKKRAPRVRGQSALVLSLCESFYAAFSFGAATQHSGGRAAGSTAASRLLVNRQLASSKPQDCCASALRGRPCRCCSILWFPLAGHCPFPSDKFGIPALCGRLPGSVRPHLPWLEISVFLPGHASVSSPALQRCSPSDLLTA
jgi:hypothetical protein